MLKEIKSKQGQQQDDEEMSDEEDEKKKKKGEEEEKVDVVAVEVEEAPKVPPPPPPPPSTLVQRLDSAKTVDTLSFFQNAGEESYPLLLIFILFFIILLLILLIIIILIISLTFNNGLQIWKIEKMIPVEIPIEDHGRFYNGDSYICLYVCFSFSFISCCNINTFIIRPIWNEFLVFGEFISGSENTLPWY